MEKKSCCCSDEPADTGDGTKKTVRHDEDKKRLVTRLSKIEGQIRGIKNMVDSDAYCTDILTQVSAARSALESLSMEILKNHINGCVKRDLKDGKDEVIDELIWTLQKLK
ncbi:MAG: metal-sensing transcriptional repressor [Treponema sp.]|uniref:metal-sensing transcriptional repressor n=1 Tax=Treponema sp. TaxID=166 RepID=UPI00298E3BFF|nr:metal-sensing transcriptional repressor [Treponema sp.]MCQ2601874.1 metal-sensing transcriptional repressor [Treponema sp.]